MGPTLTPWRAVLLVVGAVQVTVSPPPDVTVLDCSANAHLPHSEVSGAWWGGKIPLLAPGPLTFCLRLQFQRLKARNIVADLRGGETRPLLQLQVNVDSLRYCFAQEYHFVLLNYYLLPNQWYHVCIRRQGDTVQTYLDGSLTQTHSLRLNVTMEATNITLGYLDPNLYPAGLTFVGNISQVNAWKRTLEESEILAIATCQVDAKGDLISWSGRWVSIKSVTHTVPLDALCVRGIDTKTQLLPPTSFYEARFLCEGRGGVLALPRTLYEILELISTNKLSHDGQVCNVYWAGMTDLEVDGEWRSNQRGVIHTDLPWAPDEPNGLHFENCAGLDPEGYVDDDCESARCAFCSVTVGRPWTLLGSCEVSTHDRQFLLETGGSFQALGIFRGFGDYTIEQNSTGEWEWRYSNSGALVATLVTEKYNYPIGRRMWSLSRSACGQTQGDRELLLTVCGQGTFTCDDGTCVALTSRCDHKPDCIDHSDEARCRILSLAVDYKAGEPPFPFEGASLPVTAIVVLQDLRIDTKGMLLHTAFNLTLSWHDPRLTFLNLKKVLSLNAIPPNGSVWTPRVAFVNTLNHATTVMDEKTSLFVNRKGKGSGEKEDQGYAEEKELFQGTENPLVSRRLYEASFSCAFELSLYPFDHQTCFLLLRLQSPSPVAFDLSASSVTYEGSPLLIEYEVGEVGMEPGSKQRELKVVVPLTRRHGYAFINIYLPSLTMLLIGFLTLFFRRQLFDVRVMTALTTLLVMATLFSQVADSLPNTSYFKMVDVWLLFCIFCTFLIIVFHVLIDRAVTSDGEAGPHSVASSVSVASETETKGLFSVTPKHGIFSRSSKPVSLLDKEHQPGGGRGKIGHGRKLSSVPTAWAHSSLSSGKEGRQDPLDHPCRADSVERAGRVFVSLVFVVFNLTYWLSIYRESNGF